MRLPLLIFLIISYTTVLQSQTKNYKIHTVAFYNLENLFDTINDPEKNDEASPMAVIKNNRQEIYFQKINNMAKVISEIGSEKTNTSPSVIGVAEVENKQVLEDLVNHKYLIHKNYGIIHQDSPDLRGIDVALLYRKRHFTPIHYQSHTLKLWNAKGVRIHTRDQLVVAGYLENELIYIIVNHWPSRRGGAAKSSPLREKAAFLNTKIMDSIYTVTPNAKILTMGDFNDDPINKSIKTVLATQTNSATVDSTDLYNPYEILYKKGYSTLAYRDNTNLFDQIIINKSLISKNKNYQSFCFYKAYIFNPSYLTLQKGKFKGYPYRSFGNQSFTGGYSDHYPVYIYLIKK